VEHCGGRDSRRSISEACIRGTRKLRLDRKWYSRILIFRVEFAARFDCHISNKDSSCVWWIQFKWERANTDHTWLFQSHIAPDDIVTNTATHDGFSNDGTDNFVSNTATHDGVSNDGTDHSFSNDATDYPLPNKSAHEAANDQSSNSVSNKATNKAANVQLSNSVSNKAANKTANVQVSNSVSNKETNYATDDQVPNSVSNSNSH
jgi:hypothetical protein